MTIPLVDIRLQYEFMADEAAQEISRILESGDYILGEDVTLFEEAFSSYCHTRFGIGVASGTDALHLSLRALGITQGDEVITQANTFIATVLAISYVGAKPALVDIDQETYNIDATQIEKAITDKTKAIIPVHLYGQPADMDPILKLAKKHRLKVIEDACQAHGSEYKGKRVGSLGDLGCLSFYPAKNLGAFGDGGMIVTDSKELVDKLRMLRNYGQPKKYYHAMKGFNSRLDTLQAALLNLKLRWLDAWNDSRREHAALYNRLLESLDVITPKEADYAKHVYHLYVIQLEQREKVQRYLSSVGISTGVHYPVPIHLQEAYRDIGYIKGDFPVTEKCSGNILSLPMFPELSDQQIRAVTHSVSHVVKERRGVLL